MSEVVLLTQLARKLNLMFRLLVPPRISGILVIRIGIFILSHPYDCFYPSSYSFRVAGYPSGPTIVLKAHSPFGWVETKPWLVLRYIG